MLKQQLWRFYDLWERQHAGRKLISFNARPKSGPWGGGNQWLQSMITFLESQGFAVNFQLVPATSLIFVLNTKGMATGNLDDRIQNNITFGLKEIENFKKRFPDVKCIQRINDSDAHRNSDHIDRAFEKVNTVVDHTVFISDWAYQYHQSIWFQSQKPHTTIRLGADETLFYPNPNATWNTSRPLKIVTHHWSSHLNKGFDAYQALDEHISNDKLRGVEFRIIGNFPNHLTWKKTEFIKPCKGIELANALRECDAYITGSRFEAGGMHLTEGLQCGLPAIYHKDGGGICEVAKQFGVAFGNNEQSLIEAVETLKIDYSTFKSKLLNSLPSESRMNQEYLTIFKELVETPSRVAHK